MERKGKTMWRQYKKYNAQFRRQVLEELMTGPDSYTDLTRRYGLSAGLLSQWTKRYGGHPMSEEEEDSRTLRARVAELERMVGRLTMENDFLKKFAAYAKQQTNERSSIITAKTLKASSPAAGSLDLAGARITTGGGTVP